MPVEATISAFVNEPYSDFAKPDVWAAAQGALLKVRSELGREYPLWIAGAQHRTGDFLTSTNPSYSSAQTAEIVGRAHKATATLAAHAVEDAHAYFAEWRRTSPAHRAELVFRAAAILRDRKYEFDAWLVVEAGKTWPEAEADVGSHRLLRILRPRDAASSPAAEMVQLPGERDEMMYLPLGAGVIIPPWNFPLAILAGMTVAALVAGNTVIVKPSSETPIIAHEVRSGSARSRIPAAQLHPVHGQRSGGRRCSGGASQDAFRFLHRLARCGPAHQRTGREAAQRADLDQARDGGDGRQGRDYCGSRSRSG